MKMHTIVYHQGHWVVLLMCTQLPGLVAEHHLVATCTSVTIAVRVCNALNGGANIEPHQWAGIEWNHRATLLTIDDPATMGGA